MTVNEAKEILLTTKLTPVIREAINVLLPDLLKRYDLPGEEWRDVVAYEGYYQVSNLGRVRSFRHSKIKILNPDLSKAGYLRAELRSPHKRRKCFVHVLVAEAFVPNPDNKPFVNHINGIKSDNRLENLEWTTSSENQKHAYSTGLHPSGCNRQNAKLTAEQVREIRRDCVPGDPELGFKPFARKFNVSNETIKKVYYRETYKNVE